MSIYKCAKCGRYTFSAKHCGLPTILLIDERGRIRLSKLLSLILRHKPEIVNSSIDREGFLSCSVDELVGRIKSLKGFSWVKTEHVYAIAETDEKGRFEIRNGRIRALYGHSIPVQMKYKRGEVPDVLYHGTRRSAVDLILKEGLKPMKRNMVHLTSSIRDAYIVGLRKDSKPVILVIDAKRAVSEGVDIRRACRNVYVSSYIPPRFIRVLKGEHRSVL